MSNTTEDQIVAHLRKLLNERDEQSRKRIADLERDLAHSRVLERQLAAELAHLRSELANQLLAIEIATTEAASHVTHDHVSSAIDTSLSDPRPGKLLVVRVDDDDVECMQQKIQLDITAQQWVGWLTPLPG